MKMPSHTYITESRTTSFQEGEDDVDIPRVTQDHISVTQAPALQGPITSSHAKKLLQKVNSFLAEINSKIYENVILPKCCTLVVLRNIHEEDGTPKYGEEVNNKKQSDQESPAQTKDLGEFHSDNCSDKPGNQESSIRNEDPRGFRSDDCSDKFGNQKSPIRNKDPGSSLHTSTSGQFGPA
jgi:hypothetical protein